jgi:hypothetical protein
VSGVAFLSTLAVDDDDRGTVWLGTKNWCTGGVGSTGQRGTKTHGRGDVN